MGVICLGVLPTTYIVETVFRNATLSWIDEGQARIADTILATESGVVPRTQDGWSPKEIQADAMNMRPIEDKEEYFVPIQGLFDDATLSHDVLDGLENGKLQEQLELRYQLRAGEVSADAGAADVVKLPSKGMPFVLARRDWPTSLIGVYALIRSQTIVLVGFAVLALSWVGVRRIWGMPGDEATNGLVDATRGYTYRLRRVGAGQGLTLIDGGNDQFWRIAAGSIVPTCGLVWIWDASAALADEKN
jgi:hypothetical protein